jgi:lipopolysaccharide transport protein LptA
MCEAGALLMALTDDSEARTGPRGALRGAAKIARRRAAAFRASHRHTLLVRGLRILLPAAVIGMFGFYSWLLFGKLSLKIGGGKVQVAKLEFTNEDLKMKGVSYSGATKDGGRYDVRAREAQVDLAQTGPIKLDYIEGDMTQPSGVATMLKSRRGAIDNKKGEMDLFDGVEINASNGFKARMKSAKVFQKENRVIANEGVIADLPTGRIEARSMNMETKDRKGTFAGNVAVQMTQDPNAPRAAVGLGRDARAPLDVRSQKLDIDDTAKFAYFTGGVAASQGDSVLNASALRVLYEGQATLPGQAAPIAATPAQSRVSKLQATGQVVITSGVDRRVTADAVEFDVPADTAIFSGAIVEVQQGKNRLVGRRLFVDRKAGKSRLESPADGRIPAGRIQTTFYQSDAKTAATAAKPKSTAPAEGTASALFNVRQDPTAPMDVEAATLEVNDPQKQAIYRGDVRAQQGDFVIKAAEVTATYTGDTGLLATPDAAPAAKGPTQGAQISRIDAKTKVVITTKAGEEATGDWAIYDVKANSVLMGGGVFLQQGTTKLRGSTLRMNTLTGEVTVANEPGQPVIGAALAPMTAPKSAPGPGGLPGIVPATAAPKPPSGVGDCPPGRMCIELFPNDAKKAAADRKERVPAKPKAPTEGWQPGGSPSPVYRAP